MRRTAMLGLLVVFGALSMAIQAYQAPQGLSPAALEATKLEKVRDNLYIITGSSPANRDAFSGGNTAVFITERGVVLVDTKLKGWGQVILDKVNSITDKPVTMIINTHTHGDHTGSNDAFGATVDVVAHENTKTNMEKMDAFKDPAKKHGLPDKTYKDKLTLLSGNDSVDLYYYGPAHTNGDSFVVFRSARVMHAGDAFARKGQPLIDVNNGGSGIAYGETIGKAASGIKNVDTVITGHSTVMKWQDFSDYGEFNRLFLAHARESLKANKTPEQAMADLKLPDKFKEYDLAGGRGGPGGNFGVIFQELQK
jgi:cyclase